MEDIKDTKTTVSLSPETKEQLANFGKKGESFDAILQRVMFARLICAQVSYLKTELIPHYN